MLLQGRSSPRGTSISSTATDQSRLSNAQLRAFLRDGYVVLQPQDLDAAFHAALFDAACQVHDEARAIGGDSLHLQVIGDNLRARIPLLERLLRCPAVRGALNSVLGDGHLLHPHHFVHEASTYDQSFHQDGNLPWNDRAHYRTHRPNWAMLFYYPQPVTLASGPTEVLPGSQYWTTNFEKPDGTWHRGDAVDKKLRGEELNNGDLAARDRRLAKVVESLGIAGIEPRKIELPAGSVVLAHYDLMHRGTRKDAAFDGRRFMYKFYYLRTRDPVASTGSLPNLLPAGERSATSNIVETIWHWLNGDGSWQPEVAATDQVAGVQAADAEDERVRLAYEIGWLARCDGAILNQLGRLLTVEDEAVRRSVAYAAGIVGQASESIVLAALSNEDARVRRVAAYAAGEARLATQPAIGALFGCLEGDPDDLARSNAAYALGNIARVPDAAVSAARLLARLDPAVEPDNTANGGMRRSTVRVNILYALCNMQLEDAELATLAETGLGDHDRYVQGLAVALLERHARSRAASWMTPLLEHLLRARYSDRPPRPVSYNARTDHLEKRR